MANSQGNRKRKRDLRVADLSINLVPEEKRRAHRALRQAILARELHEALFLCMDNGLFMPTLGLLRSLIDTCALGLWFLKYAKDEDISDSVANLNTPVLVKNYFDQKDKEMFEFIFEELRGTENEVYRDVLHPSIHGDALHVDMRLRDRESKKTWVHECVIRTNVLFVWFTLQFSNRYTKEVLEIKGIIKPNTLSIIKKMNAILASPEFRGMAEPFSE